MQDWNIFFSSLAQASAGIVAILVGFLASIVIANEQTFDVRRRRKVELCERAHYLSRVFTRLDISSLAQRIANDTFYRIELEAQASLNIGRDWDAYRFPIFLDRGEIVAKVEALVGSAAGGQASARRDALSAGESDQIQARMRSAVDDVMLHVRVVREFRVASATFPESRHSVKRLSLLVTPLFIVGVIYPLGLLPLGPGPIGLNLGTVLNSVISWRALLLVLTAAPLIAINRFLHNANGCLRLTEEELGELIVWENMANYSPLLSCLDGVVWTGEVLRPLGEIRSEVRLQSDG